MTDRNERLTRMADARAEQDRPRPTHELYELTGLAMLANDGDPSAALEFAVACTPQTFVLAIAAARYDKLHPIYMCYICKDGKKLPKGYQCQECGEDNPTEWAL